jgi:hypothetical protein
MIGGRLAMQVIKPLKNKRLCLIRARTKTKWKIGRMAE